MAMGKSKVANAALQAEKALYSCSPRCNRPPRANPNPERAEVRHADALAGLFRKENDPPEIVLEGTFEGKELVLHVCLEPPKDAEPTEIIDLTSPDGASVREKE
jgi:hypothetical protein